MTDPFPRKLPFLRGKPRQLVTEILSVVKHRRTYLSFEGHDTPNSRFLLLSLPRSGSSMLGSFLSNHPQIYWGNERFNPTFWAPLRFATIQASCTNLPCYGTKCFLHHLARVPKDDFGKRLLNEFSQAGWKTISLKRVNCFRHALSIEKALSSNRFLQLKGGPPPEPKLKRTVDPQMLFSLVEWIDSQNSYLDKIQESLDSLQLVYERDLDTCEQHKSTFLRCCDYLSVAPAEPVTRHLRQSAPNWTDDIANIAEIVAKFQGTPFEALVDS